MDTEYNWKDKGINSLVYKIKIQKSANFKENVAQINNWILIQQIKLILSSIQAWCSPAGEMIEKMSGNIFSKATSLLNSEQILLMDI